MIPVLGRGTRTNHELLTIVINRLYSGALKCLTCELKSTVNYLIPISFALSHLKELNLTLGLGSYKGILVLIIY